jgi:hypothetical protein
MSLNHAAIQILRLSQDYRLIISRNQTVIECECDRRFSGYCYTKAKKCDRSLVFGKVSDHTLDL